ncbi:hypothetical protein L2E82_14973 [Cichorium intybus]|uniref:Uncharacterized protein n=1 Tax=Cichorium intybus TaxID=13427 RepID=A0ACB9F1K6_CICIN|nr:hypothetical protein L2E82_14973 [Cichorium intybus]
MVNRPHAEVQAPVPDNHARARPGVKHVDRDPMAADRLCLYTPLMILLAVQPSASVNVAVIGAKSVDYRLSLVLAKSDDE